MNWEAESGHDRPDQSQMDLAAELRNLIQSLDADADPTPASDRESLAQQDQEPHEVSALIQDLRASIEETNAELILAVRLLRDLTQARIAELSDQLDATEQRLRDEINELEAHLRAEISARGRDPGREI